MLESSLTGGISTFTYTQSSVVNAHLHRDKFADELYTMLLHVFTSTVGHILVEAPKQDGPNHDCDIKTQAGQKTSTLQSHI